MGSSCFDLLPSEFQPYRQQLEATLQPYIQICVQPGQTTLTQSKFLGLPYWPLDCVYPRDADGFPMLLLAQLNFTEIPALPDFPDHGILQVFISARDELYGADLESFETMQSQKRFRVYYFEDIEQVSQCIQDFEFLRTQLSNQDLILPADKECQLTFEVRDSVISPSDYRFEQCLGPQFFDQFGLEKEECRESYWQAFSAQGHRMGGYAFFTQADPRSEAPEDEDWTLLLQIDSDDSAGVMWGDLGVGHFFIPRLNLQRRDFSRILYTWDCG